MNTQLIRFSSLGAGIRSGSRIALLLLPYMAWMGSVVSGQTNTTVNLGTQARNPDFSAMPVTRPVSVGTSLPSTCVVGQLFFNSSAQAGSNLSACTATNTWNSLGANFTLPLSVANGGTGTSTPGLVAGSNVSISGSWPNQTISGTGAAVSIGSSLPTSCTVGQLFFNSSAAAGSNLYGCTSANIWTVVGGATLTSPLPVANGGTGTSTPGLVAGANVTITGTWPNQTISGVNIGSSLPGACTVGQLFFNSAASAGSNLYGCTAANTWTVVGNANLALPLPVASGGTGTSTPSLVAGTNVTVTGSWPNQTINSSATPISGGATLPGTCTVGQVFFNTAASAGSNLYGCTSANTWTVIGGATLTSPLPVANGGTGTATPSLVAGTNVTITGNWPNQTINSTGGGTSGNATSIQGAAVATTAPSNNQTLIYNGTSSAYVPTTIYTLQNGLGTSASGTTNLQVNVSMGVRAVTTTSDIITSTDCGGLVTYNNASAVAVALPQPALGGNFVAGCPVTIRNYGAGTVTVTPSSSTIGGAASQAVNSSKGCLVVSDGTNWQLGNCN